MEINIDRVPYPLQDTNILKALHNHYDNLGHTYVVIYTRFREFTLTFRHT